MALSDRMAVMNGGRIEQTGTPRELYRRPGSRFVAEFLGDMNWIQGVGVRPECMRLSRNNATSEASTGKPCVIDDVFYLGSLAKIRIRLEGGESAVVQIAVDSDSYAPGTTVYVSWDTTDEVMLSAPSPAPVSA